MSATFDLNISVPERLVLSKQAVSLIIPAELGYMGILAHHAPIIASLVPGTITIKDSAGNITSIDTKGTGFLEFSFNKATLLLDSVT